MSQGHGLPGLLNVAAELVKTVFLRLLELERPRKPIPGWLMGNPCFEHACLTTKCKGSWRFSHQQPFPGKSVRKTGYHPIMVNALKATP